MRPGKASSSTVVQALAALAAVMPLGIAAQPRTLETELASIAVEPLVTGLEHPWGMAFLPDGRLLLTERAGRLRLLGRDGALSEPIQGVPAVFAEGQGGLLDVALDPQFDTTRYVYLSFAEPDDGGASTALGRGRLDGEQLVDFAVLFRQTPKVTGENHFGGRIVLDGAGHVFLTMGERAKFDPVQEPGSHLGSIVRLTREGAVPSNNPFVGAGTAAPEIWSYGHRNIQAAALHPETGVLWVAEMGPQGGDELNRALAGENYGWPDVSWGKHYDGREIPPPSTAPSYQDAVYHWTPVISPSGMAFYAGTMFAEWRGDLLIGSLSDRAIVRLTLDGNEVVHEERLRLGVRIRDVEVAPDNSVYAITDEADGKVLRLAAAAARDLAASPPERERTSSSLHE